MWTFFKPGEPSVKTYIGYLTRKIHWTDIDAHESYTLSFYIYGSGKRTCEVDYNGTYVELNERAKKDSHLIRLWQDAGEVPAGTVFVGEMKDAIEAKAI